MTSPLFFLAAVNIGAGHTPVLKLGENNHIQLVLTNVSGRPVRFDYGSTLKVALPRTLAAHVLDRTTVSAGLFHMARTPGALILSPHAPFHCAPGQSLTIDLARLHLPVGFTFANLLVSVLWSNVQPGATGQARVSEGGTAVLKPLPAPPWLEARLPRPPILIDWLTDPAEPRGREAGRGLVAVAPPPSPAAPDDDPFALLLQPVAPVLNRLAFRIQNGAQHALVPAPEPGATPHFVISWPTVGDPGEDGRWDALCTVEEVAEIDCRVEGDDLADWDLEQDENQGAWRLIPRSEAVLQAGQSVRVVVDRLRSSLPAYPTAMRVAYRDLPGYEDGVVTVPMEKVTAWPVVDRFTASCGARPVAPGSLVHLEWSCWGGAPYDPDPVSLTVIEDTSDVQRIDDLPSEGRYALTVRAASVRVRLDLATGGMPIQSELKVQMAPVGAQMSLAASAGADGVARLDVDVAYASGAALRLLRQRVIAPEGYYGDGGAIEPTHPSAPADVLEAYDAEWPGADPIPLDPEGRFGNVICAPPAPFDLTAVLHADGWKGPARAEARISLSRPTGVACHVAIGRSLYQADVNGVHRTGRLPGQEMSYTFLGDLNIDDNLRTAFWSDGFGAGGDSTWWPYKPNRQYGVAGQFAWGDVLVTVVRRADGVSLSAEPLNQSDDLSGLPPRWVFHLDHELPRVGPGLFRFQPAFGFVTLGGDRQLKAMSMNRAGFMVLADNVDAFDLTTDAIYFVADGELRRKGVTTPPQTVCALPGRSTNISVTADGVVHWAENQTGFGPVLCRCAPGGAMEIVTALPGEVHWGGIAIHNRDRASPPGSGPGPLGRIILTERDLTEEYRKSE